MMIHLKDDIEGARERVEAWWSGISIGRPLLQLKAKRPAPRLQLPLLEAPTTHDYWTNPDYVLPRIVNELAGTCYLAEAFPVLQPVAGRMVSITCKYLGAPNRYIDRDTTWSVPIIEEWERCPSLEIDRENAWWKISIQLLERALALIEEKELACYLSLPDLNGPTEVLSGLRDPQKLCLDMLLEPEKVKSAAAKVQAAWFEAWQGLIPYTNRYGGYLTWMGIWSDTPAIDLQSDFSTLISSEMFAEFILPLLLEQVEAFDRTIFHLDGPGMVRHLDLLLNIPGLQAIQWVQGAGGGRVSEWMELLHRIQEAGKGVYIYCDADEVPGLTAELDPCGLMLVVNGLMELCEAERLLDSVEQISAGRGRPL